MAKEVKQKKLKVFIKQLSEEGFFYQVTSLKGKRVYGTGIAANAEMNGTTLFVGPLEYYNVCKVTYTLEVE